MLKFSQFKFKLPNENLKIKLIMGIKMPNLKKYYDSTIQVIDNGF
jgi:hypothetical protein